MDKLYAAACAIALNAGGTLAFIRQTTSLKQLSGYRGALPWGVFLGAFCDAARRYKLGLLCWRGSVCMVYLQQVRRHYIAYGGMREGRWKEAEIRGRNKLETFLPPENSMCRVSDAVAFEMRIHPPWEWGEGGGGGGGSEEDAAVLRSLACWQVIASAGSEFHIVSSPPFKPNHKHPDSPDFIFSFPKILWEKQSLDFILSSPLFFFS